MTEEEYQRDLAALEVPPAGPSDEDKGRIAAARVRDDPDIMEETDVVCRVAKAIDRAFEDRFVGHEDEDDDSPSSEALIAAYAALAAMRIWI